MEYASFLERCCLAVAAAAAAAALPDGSGETTAGPEGFCSQKQKGRKKGGERQSETSSHALPPSRACLASPFGCWSLLCVVACLGRLGLVLLKVRSRGALEGLAQTEVGQADVALAIDQDVVGFLRRKRRGKQTQEESKHTSERMILLPLLLSLFLSLARLARLICVG